MKFNPEIFKAYDVRGIYPGEITPELAYQIGWAYGKFLKADLHTELPARVALGLDMRGSSPFLAREVLHGLVDQGLDVADIGRVPTPAFYYAIAFRDLAGGVMVTASHNPKEYNGFKFCARQAAPIGLDSGLQQIRAYLEAETKWAKNARRGEVKNWEVITAQYVSQDLSYVDSGKIKKWKIAADPANAMGSAYLEELFQRIPCEPIKLNWDLNGNMPVHEANPLKEETLQQLQAVIKNAGADLGIATDGDGDRIVFLDEQAVIIPSAVIVGLIAQVLLRKYPGSKIGCDLRLSRVAREMVSAAGGVPVETMVGHTLIKKFMREQEILFAGELSSHYYFRENYNFESPVFVTALLLLLRSELDKPFSEIWRPYQKYAQSGEINFAVSDKAAVLARLAKEYADGKQSKLDGLKVDYPDWWFSVRPSNTEPLLRLNVEAADAAALKQKIAALEAAINA